MTLRDLAGRRITVMGLGRFGGGTGVARWLAGHNARVHVTDLQPKNSLSDSLATISNLIESKKVTLRLGEHFKDDFTSADMIVANPAVPLPWTNPYLEAARTASVPITTEIRLVTERINHNRVIGVTGTAGKSTTAAMIHHILDRSMACSHFAGNIGGSLLNHLSEIRDDDWIVLELSSAMLYWLDASVGYKDAPGWSPHVAVMTNLSPNHLDWHGTFEHYQQSKLNIFKHQGLDNHRITSADVEGDSEHIELKIPGVHNQFNARMAVAAVNRVIDISTPEARTKLADFPGLPHRLQLVAEQDGMTFYNDSKSTTPEATVLAVSSFDDSSKVHLIVGGYDKKIDLKTIAELAESIGGLYTIGATGRALANAAHRGHAEYCETLDRAVEHAMARMNDGDVLLLSPGCASWDQFTNYEHRGDMFRELVCKQLHRAGVV